jgi:hypothetical protein
LNRQDAKFAKEEKEEGERGEFNSFLFFLSPLPWRTWRLGGSILFFDPPFALGCPLWIPVLHGEADDVENPTSGTDRP